MSDRQPIFARLAIWQRWLLLGVVTAALVAPMEMIGLPAGFMLGAMVAGILVQLAGAGVRVPPQATRVSEGLLGALIAASITPLALRTFLAHAPLFLAIGLVIIAASSAMGWVLLKMRRFPGTTAIWGLSPGAAQVMMIMARPYGADERLVAFMQYLRILMVAAAAPVTAKLWGQPSTLPVALVGAGFDWLGFAASLAIVALGLALAARISLPAGTFLLPMVIGAVLHAAGLVAVTLPAGLMAVSFVVLGWGVGMNFTLPVLRHALATLPVTVAAMTLLLAFCGLLAALLTHLTGIEPLTAYLATSPGGMSSVAVIAATSRVDVGFVISMQTLRFMMVLLLGPPISRFLAVRAGVGRMD